VRKAILRLVHKHVAGPEERTVTLHTLDGGESYVIDEYVVEPDSLIIQYPDSPDAYRLEALRLELAPPPWTPYCRWHSGSLWERDEPWKRIYCTAPAEGYCRQHRRSERAVYEACVSLPGERGLAACRALDALGRTTYAVYVTDGGGAGKAKVGMTRMFRLLDRLAEQPHRAAAVVYEADSAYEARRAELAISRAGLASERRARSPRRGHQLPEAAALVASVAEKAARLVGGEWDGRLLRVTSSAERLVSTLRESRPERLVGARWSVSGYWGGYLALYSPGRGRAVVNEKRLLHLEALLVD